MTESKTTLTVAQIHGRARNLVESLRRESARLTKEGEVK
jgi:hypothetical protein